MRRISRGVEMRGELPRDAPLSLPCSSSSRVIALKRDRSRRSSNNNTGSNRRRAVRLSWRQVSEQDRDIRRSINVTLFSFPPPSFVPPLFLSLKAGVIQIKARVSPYMESTCCDKTLMKDRLPAMFNKQW